jgi:hypothetical protein
LIWRQRHCLQAVPWHEERTTWRFRGILSCGDMNKNSSDLAKRAMNKIFSRSAETKQRRRVVAADFATIAFGDLGRIEP